MGMFDTVTDNKGFDDQVKIWDSVMATYTIGDNVPPVKGNTTYSIAMRKGGFINVADGVILEWGSNPLDAPVFDKWGRTVADPYNAY